MLQRMTGLFNTYKLGTSTTTVNTKLVDEKTSLQTIHAASILKKIPLSEVWRLFIDGRQQKQKIGSSVSGIEFTGQFTEELLNLKCVDIYKILSSSPLAKQSSLEKSILSWSDDLKFEFMSVMDDFDLNTLFKDAFTDYAVVRGWVGFERKENGYLDALCKALKYSFEHIYDLDVRYIQTLHYHATKDVTGLNSNIGKKNSSDNLDKFRDIHDVVSLNIFYNVDFTDSNDVSDAKKSFSSILMKIASGDHSYLSIVITDTKSNKTVIDVNNISLKSPDQWFEFAKSQQSVCLYSRYDVNNSFEKLVSQFIQKFESHMKIAVNEKNKKLEAIITFIQDLCHLHPFNDGQTRTFVMVLLNQLLLKNGFLPVIMANPNHFEKFSVARLAKEVTLGMKNVLRLCLREPIFGITTEELFSDCTSEQKAYFIKSIKELSMYFEPLPVVGVSQSRDHDEKSICKIGVDDVVNLMFELYENNLLSDPLLSDFISVTKRDKAFAMGSDLLSLLPKHNSNNESQAMGSNLKLS